MSDEELASFKEEGLEEGDLADYAMPVKGLATKGLRGLAREGVQLASRKGSQALNEQIAEDTGLPPPSMGMSPGGIVAAMAKGKPPRDDLKLGKYSSDGMKEPVRKGPGTVDLGDYWKREAPDTSQANIIDYSSGKPTVTIRRPRK
jgi:hypothetical protein